MLYEFVALYVCSVAQLCLTLCNPMDCCLLGSSVHGLLQVRILEWLPFPSPGDLSTQGSICNSWISYLARKIVYH